MQNTPKVYAIVGPTASGKTALALKWANILGTEIINFDSRQVYKELNIGVARPSLEELNSVQHHFIASHSILEPLNASKFSSLARKKATELIEARGSVVLVGGTGLYLDAFLNGLDEFPEVTPEIRAWVQKTYDMQGLDGIVEALRSLDANAFEWVQEQNPARVMRALEICKASGLKVAEWRRNQGKPFEFASEIFGIDMDRKALYARIEARVELMVEMGLEQEVRSLEEYQNLSVMRTLGYREFFDYFNGELDKETCISLIKQKTRNYAKRQLTWFKNKTEAQFSPIGKLSKHLS